MNTSNNKKNPSKCSVKVDCKATAALEEQVEAELQEEDKPLEEILDETNSV